MPGQFNDEGRQPRRPETGHIHRQRLGWRGCDRPAGKGGTGGRFCPQADAQGAHPGGGGRPDKALGGAEVESLRLSPGLNQDRPQSRTAQTLMAGPERRQHIAGPDQNHPPRIDAEFQQASPMGHAIFPGQPIVLHPEDGAVGPRRPARKGQGKGFGGHAIAAGGRKDFMHGSERQTATQSRIHGGHAEGDPGRSCIAQPRFMCRQGIDTSQKTPEARQCLSFGRHLYVPVLF